MKLPTFFDTKVTKSEGNKGRIRSKEHVHGNWPTIIYIPIKLNGDVVDSIKDYFKEFDLVQVDPLSSEPFAFPLSSESNTFPLSSETYTFHISLTRTLYVKDHQKDLFKQKINETTSTFKNFPLKLKCEKVKIYLNDEMTRTFIAIDVENDEIILKYIESIDKILKDFGLPVYYKSPKLHFSLFWCKGNEKENLEKYEMDLKGIEVEIKEIFMKCGNKTTRI